MEVSILHYKIMLSAKRKNSLDKELLKFQKTIQREQTSNYLPRHSYKA